MLVLVLGAQGVGKSTAVAKAAKGWNVINFGDVVQAMIKEDRDVFRRQASLEKLKKVQRKAAQKIAKMIRGNTIVISHGVLYREDGFFPAFPVWVLEKIKPDKIVIIWSKPSDIAKRRKREKRRKRDLVPIKIIAEEQRLSEMIAMCYSFYTGATVAKIENPEGKIEKAVKELKRILKHV